MHDVALFVSQLASFAPIVLIPSASDLVDPWWPMQPISPLALGGIAAKFDVRAGTNPTEFEVSMGSRQVRFLGTDGSNVYDQLRYTQERSKNEGEQDISLEGTRLS